MTSVIVDEQVTIYGPRPDEALPFLVAQMDDIEREIAGYRLQILGAEARRAQVMMQMDTIWKINRERVSRQHLRERMEEVHQ